MDSTTSLQELSPFFRLPTEIRFIIYEYTQNAEMRAREVQMRCATVMTAHLIQARSTMLSIQYDTRVLLSTFSARVSG